MGNSSVNEASVHITGFIMPGREISADLDRINLQLKKFNFEERLAKNFTFEELGLSESAKRQIEKLQSFLDEGEQITGVPRAVRVFFVRGDNGLQIQNMALIESERYFSNVAREKLDGILKVDGSKTEKESRKCPNFDSAVSILIYDPDQTKKILDRLPTPSKRRGL